MSGESKSWKGIGGATPLSNSRPRFLALFLQTLSSSCTRCTRESSRSSVSLNLLCTWTQGMVILLGHVTFTDTFKQGQGTQSCTASMYPNEIQAKKHTLRYVTLRIHARNDVCMHHVLKEPQADLDINFPVLEVDCATTLNARVVRHLNSL